MSVCTTTCYLLETQVNSWTRTIIEGGKRHVNTTF